MRVALAAAVNDETVLGQCLSRSPDLQRFSQVILQRGFRSAAVAYNDALDKAKADIIVFVHQDIYLPAGWYERFVQTIDRINEFDARWGVLGAWGLNSESDWFGHVFCTASMRELGRVFEGGLEVKALDEIMLVLRKSSGLRFDEQLPGFHLYGTDICLEAARKRMKNYAISAYCVHNSDAYRLFPPSFWRACFYLRKKWISELPIMAPCITITRWGWPILHWNIMRVVNLALGRVKIGRRVADPSSLPCNSKIGSRFLADAEDAKVSRP